MAKNKCDNKYPWSGDSQDNSIPLHCISSNFILLYEYVFMIQNEYDF